MASNTCTDEPTAAVAPGRGATAAGLARLVDCVRGADRLLAEAVALAGELAGSGVCEQVEGLPLERFTGLAARMTHADARLLVTAGQTLAAMPVIATLFRDGQLGWGQVRAIVAATARLSRADRATVDARVAETARRFEHGVAAFDPDGLVWAVDAAVEELTPRETERHEARRVEGNFLSRQMDFDGGMRLVAGYDPLAAAVVNTTLDAAMGRLPAGAAHTTTHPDADGDGDEVEVEVGDGPVVGRWSPTPVAKAAANALVEVCAEWLAGDPAPGDVGAGDSDQTAARDTGADPTGDGSTAAAGAGTGAGETGAGAGTGAAGAGGRRRRRARPLLVAHVDLAQVSATPSGTVELNLRGPLPRIGAATLERLARDADFKAVLFDGTRPLAVSRQVRLKDIPAKTAFALRSRDQGCRFPGSLDPVGWTDIDHIIQRQHGGDHHPDRLVRLSRPAHVWRHRYGWTITLNPQDGMVTVARGRRRFHSLPNGTRLAPAPDNPDPPDPPGPPPGRPPDPPPRRPHDPPLPF